MKKIQANVIEYTDAGIEIVTNHYQVMSDVVVEKHNEICLASTTVGTVYVYDVDYHNNPTYLFKLIESKDWDSVKARVDEHPHECAGRITRRKKGGGVRWILLPLHAVLCVKAPKDIVLSILHAFPYASSLPDDQGMLPIHFAMSVENVDEEIVETLLEINPSSINFKNREGRTAMSIQRSKSSLSSQSNKESNMDNKVTTNQSS